MANVKTIYKRSEGLAEVPTSYCPGCTHGIIHKLVAETLVELDVLDRKVMQLEIEIEAIKREKDEVKLKSLRSDLANLKEERNEMSAKWKSEKEVVDNIQNAKLVIENFKFEAEKAEREGDYGKVAEIRYGKIKTAQENLEQLQKDVPILKTTVDLYEEFYAYLKTFPKKDQYMLGKHCENHIIVFLDFILTF